MRQNQVEESEGEEGSDSAGVEQVLVQPGKRSADDLPPAKQPPPKKANKKSSPKTYQHFSKGFNKRLVGISADDLTPFWDFKGRKQICQMDCSKLLKDQMLEFAARAFEIYYTDKSVSQLVFEHNSVRFVGGLKGRLN